MAQRVAQRLYDVFTHAISREGFFCVRAQNMRLRKAVELEFKLAIKGLKATLQDRTFSAKSLPSLGTGMIDVQKLSALQLFAGPTGPSAAWSICKNWGAVQLFNIATRPSSGISVDDVQKLQCLMILCSRISF